MKVLFIGLGRMGYAMAGHLSQLDTVSLAVKNRSAALVK